MSDYKKLIVWEKAIDFSVLIYTITKSFPSSEEFGLKSQLRRACVSIPSNIAEGSKRSTDKDFRSFLCISLGSGAEIETQLLIAYKLKYIYEKEYNDATKVLAEIMRILVTLIKKLN